MGAVSVTAAALLAQPAPSSAPGASYTETIPGTAVTFEMVAVPGGTFKMGSPDGESGRQADEGPQVEVALKPFWIGKHEVYERLLKGTFRGDFHALLEWRRGLLRPAEPLQGPF